MKKALAFFLLSFSAALGQYYPPVSLAAQNPSGQFVPVGLDSTGRLYLSSSSSSSVATALAGYVGPVAMTAQNPSGQQVYVKADANGNLMVSGGGSSTPTIQGTPNAIYSFTATGDQSCTASGSITDLSGNNNNATYGSTPPACIGTGLDFNNSTNSFVSLPTALNSDLGFCAYVGFKLYGQSGPPTGPAFDFLMASSNINASGASWLVSGSDQIYSPFSFSNGSIRTQSNKNNAEAGNHVYCWILGQAGQTSTTDRFFVDGLEQLYTQTGASGGLQTANNYVIGRNNFSQPGYYDGQLYYFVGWATQPTVAQIKATSFSLINTVAAKGVQTVSTFAVNPTISFIAAGDSITDGWLASTPWTSNMTLVGGYTIVNEGYYGISAQSQMGQARWRDGPLCNSYYRSMALIFAGTNDVANGTSPGGTIGYLMTYANQVSKAGCQAIIATMLSRTGQDTNKDTLNTYIRQNAIMGGYIVADFASDTHLGCDGCFSNLTYFTVDGVHLTQTGQNLVAAEASNIINAYGFGAASQSNPTIYSSNAVTMTSSDRYTTIIPTAAATATLPDCLGVTGTVYEIFNASLGANTITFSGKASEAIAGGTTLAQNTTARFSATLISQAAAGCGWQRKQ